jgi:hypothetical protein
MSRSLRAFFVLVLTLLSLSWPFLLAAAIAGQRGLYFGLVFYLTIGGLLLAVVAFGGIRGVLDT